MPESNICRLCVTECDEHKSLYDQFGGSNRWYEIICNFFHPTIVDMDQAEDLTVICIKCWRHIRDFNDFKISTFVAQAKLKKRLTEEAIKKTKELNPTEDQEQLMVKIEKVEEAHPVSITSSANVIIKTEVKEFMEETGAGEVVVDNSINEDVNHHLMVVKSETSDAIMQAEFTDENTHQQQPLNNISMNDNIVVKSELELIDVYEGDEPASSSDDDDSITSDVICVTEKIAPRSLSKKLYGKNKRFGLTREERNEKLDELIANWVKSVKCQVCSQTFPKHSLLRQHFLQQHPNVTFFISCCKRKFSHVRHIEDHFLLHNDPNAFKCHICHRCHTTDNCLRRHMALYHPTNSHMHVCKLCRKVFARKGALHLHYSASHGITPQHPNSTVQEKDSVAVELNDSQNTEGNNDFVFTPKVELTEEDDRMQDEEQEPNSSGYNIFMMKSGSEETEEEEELEKDEEFHRTRSKRKTSTKSPTTESENSSKIKLNIGMKWKKRADKLDVLIAKSIKNIKCVVCAEPFTKYLALREHFLSRHRKVKFHISCCERKLNSLRQIESHILLHNDPNAFQCAECGRCHTNYRNLKNHMTMHH